MGHYHLASTRIFVSKELYSEVYQRPRKACFYIFIHLLLSLCGGGHLSVQSPGGPSEDNFEARVLSFCLWSIELKTVWLLGECSYPLGGSITSMPGNSCFCGSCVPGAWIMRKRKGLRNHWGKGGRNKEQGKKEGEESHCLLPEDLL